MTENPKPVLGYWDIRGAAQPIRHLLKYMNIDYDETVYLSTLSPVSDEWLADKWNLGLEFPNLPYWIDGKTRLTESRAIIKHLARVHDPSLLPPPADETSLCRTDMLEEVLVDIWRSLGTVCYINLPQTIQTYDTVVPQKLEMVAKFVGTNEWCLGDKLSYLDFLIYEVLYHTLVYRPNILDKHPNLSQLMRHFEQIPAIAKFMESKTYITSPCFKRCTTVKI